MRVRKDVLTEVATHTTPPLTAPGIKAASATRRRNQTDRSGSKTSIRLIEGAYVMLLGFLMTKLIYVLLTPLATPETLPSGVGPGPAPVDLSLLSRFDPFIGVVVPAQQPTYVAAQETKLNLKLVGVTYVDENGRTSATIEADSGDQRPYFEGDAISDGVTIRDILPEQVILLRNGVAETLSLEGRDPEAAGARSPVHSPQRGQAGIRTAASGSGSPVAFGDLSAFVQLRPEAGGIGLYPGASPDAFARVGLKAGDVLVAVNGNPVSTALTQRPGSIVNMLTAGPARFTVERDGNPIELSIDPTRITQ
ncbi:MAG: type II secretion system protein N [Pseudomonadota bacterium]